MDQVSEFFSKLFKTEDWPPRWASGEWTEFHGWLYIISDVVIWMSYFAIPFFILAFIFKKDDVPLPKVFWLFGAFILLCGLTHLMDALTFWWPAYRLSALLRFFTAVVSFTTVIALFDFFPAALGLRTSGQYEKELAKRREAEENLKAAQLRLQTYNAQVLAKNTEIQQFASIVSHDLKAPLQSVTTVVDLLRRKTGAQADPELEEYYHFLDESTERMRAVIVDLLDYSRLGTNKNVETINTQDVLQEVLSDLRGRIAEENATLNLPAQPLPIVRGYRTELRMIFQNLINNAIKFRKSDVKPVVTINWQEREKDWLFEVADNGIGIPSREQEKIFLIFRTAHGENYEGTGIGLAHAQRIVQLHEGQIWVEPKPDGGSRFCFTIAKNIGNGSSGPA